MALHEVGGLGGEGAAVFVTGLRCDVLHGAFDRVGRPEEIAKVALFLASDDASFINGAEPFDNSGITQI